MGERQKIDFDIDRYLRNSRRLDLSELPWEDIPNHRADIPGFEGLRLLEGVLDDALVRAPKQPARREERALVAV
jgi:hypothetical protein